MFGILWHKETRSPVHRESARVDSSHLPELCVTKFHEASLSSTRGHLLHYSTLSLREFSKVRISSSQGDSADLSTLTVTQFSKPRNKNQVDST